MRKYLLLSLFVLSSIIFIGCGGSSTRLESNKPISNEVSCIEGDNKGGQIYKVLAWGIGDNNESAEIDAKKAAVYSALTGRQGSGNCSIAALFSPEELDKNNDFIESFFAYENQWAQYVTDVNNGKILPGNRIELSDGRVKIGMEIIVSVKKLEEDLLAKGILKNRLKWGE